MKTYFRILKVKRYPNDDFPHSVDAYLVQKKKSWWFGKWVTIATCRTYGLAEAALNGVQE